MRAIDLTGQRFGRLTVVSYKGSDKDSFARWLCVCDCGNQKIVMARNLKSGATTSCGCFQKEQVIKRTTTHGMTNTRLHGRWLQMRGRCKNPHNYSYKNYGAKGVTVCQRWDNFENFYKDMGEPSKGFTIERINNNGNYEPSNCCWADRMTQSNNLSRNVLIEYKGQQLTIAQWAKKLGMKYYTLFNRIQRYNWPIEKALSLSVGEKLEPYLVKEVE